VKRVQRWVGAALILCHCGLCDRTSDLNVQLCFMGRNPSITSFLNLRSDITQGAAFSFRRKRRGRQAYGLIFRDRVGGVISSDLVGGLH